MMAAKPRSVGISTQPDEDGFAYDVILRNEAPVAGIRGAMAVVALHPIVVHLECVLRSLVTINKDVAFGSYLQVVAFVVTNGTLVNGNVV